MELIMDFIERTLGFSPDNGSGSIEVLLFLIPLLCVAYLVSRRSRISRHTR